MFHDKYSSILTGFDLKSFRLFNLNETFFCKRMNFLHWNYSVKMLHVKYTPTSLWCANIKMCWQLKQRHLKYHRLKSNRCLIFVKFMVKLNQNIPQNVGRIDCSQSVSYSASMPFQASKTFHRLKMHQQNKHHCAYLIIYIVIHITQWL